MLWRAMKRLAKVLGGFELGGFLGRAKNLQAASPENIHYASRQRRFRADNGEVDLVLLGEISQCFRVSDIDVFQLVLTRRARHCPGQRKPFAGRGFWRGARPWRVRDRRNR
jgi:hypothetical protein